MLHSLIAETAASATSGSSSDHPTTLLVAIVMGIPGLWGAYTGWKARQDNRRRSDKRENFDLSKMGADILQKEVDRLIKERARWEEDREEWFDTKNSLMLKITKLSDQLDQTNQYLYQVVAQMRTHGIEPPAAPPWMESTHLR
jgi:hypothetical protein